MAQLLLEEEAQEKLGPVGPWAIGRVNKRTDNAALTGIRPVVGTLSTSFLEPSEWRHAHRQLLVDSTASRIQFQNVENEARSASCQMLSNLEKMDRSATSALRERAASLRNRIDHLVLIERQMALEVHQLIPIPPRLRRAQDAMSLVYSIAAECLAIRSRRPEAEMKGDEVEKLLIEEASTAHEGRCLAARCAAEVEQQISACRDELDRLHDDWSLKTVALTAERSAIAHGSEVAPLKIAACMAPTETMGPPTEEWHKRALHILQAAEQERERSVRLRGRAEPLIRQTGRDLARRGIMVDDAIKKNVDVLVATVGELELELSMVLERQVGAEALCRELNKASWQTGPPLKSAQSRLVERRARPPTERTPDEPQSILLDEVGTALAMDTGIKERLANAEKCLQDLWVKRGRLERAIHLKKRALHLDRDRVRQIRSSLPPTTALQGMD